MATQQKRLEDEKATLTLTVTEMEGRLDAMQKQEQDRLKELDEASAKVHTHNQPTNPTLPHAHMHTRTGAGAGASTQRAYRPINQPHHMGTCTTISRLPNQPTYQPHGHMHINQPTNKLTNLTTTCAHA